MLARHAASFLILAFLGWNGRNNFAQEECHALIKEQICFRSSPKWAPPLPKHQDSTPKCVGRRLIQRICTSPSSSVIPSTSELPFVPSFCPEIARSARSPASCESFPHSAVNHGSAVVNGTRVRGRKEPCRSNCPSTHRI